VARGIVTAGAALAHVDLGLWLIRQKSPALATLTARYLLIDNRSSQAMFALADHLAHNDPLVERFESWARATLGKGFSLDEAASAVGTSKRNAATLRALLRRKMGRAVSELRL
jgi:transcriptional regulator GlxA family with amidase domain